MSIHFKFKSAKEFDTVTFPGAAIRVLDLKKAIVDKKKLAKGLDFDLVITDAQNGKVYEDENTQLPRNTSVTVKRIPSKQPGSGLLARMKQEAAVAAAAAAAIQLSPPVAAMAGPSPVGPTPIQPMATLSLNTEDSAEGAQTMEDEMAALQSIHEQAEDMRGSRLGNKTWTASSGSNANNVMNYYSASGPGGEASGRGNGASGRGFGRGGRGGDFGGRGGGMNGRGGGRGTGPGAPNGSNLLGDPPSNYVCYRCGTPGHYIQNCPTNGDPEFDQHRVKKKTGIPKSFMKAVSDPSEIPVGAGKTVVNAPWGGLAVIEPQNKNFSKLMAQSGGSATLDQFISNPPEHLACPLCRRLMSDAVLIPCCQESACDECLRGALIEHKLTCPLCNVSNMSPEKLLPNKVLRTSVDEFLRRARTEQQEREQLVKEAEEKAMAKQKAAEQTAGSASRRSGDSADATLEIKKGKKGDGGDDEEDEFGGDIFGEGVENEDASLSPQKTATSLSMSPSQQNPPLPKDDKVTAKEGEVADGPSRKTSDASSNGGGQTADNTDKSIPTSGSQGLPSSQGPPIQQMPWGRDGPRGPPLGFNAPPGPWFDGPPRGQPGPWFDGPPGPWFDGSFQGPGGPRGAMKGGRGGGRGRGGRGMPPPGYFGGPGPDYFAPPPGHPDYFGPPPPWFDGPMPPFGGRGGDRWFDGESRGRDDDRRRDRSTSRDRDRSRTLDRSTGRDGKGERVRRGGDGKETRGSRRGDRKESCGARGGDRERSKRSRSRSRSFKAGRSRSNSRLRHDKKTREHASSSRAWSSRASSSRRSRSASRNRHHREHKNSSNRNDANEGSNKNSGKAVSRASNRDAKKDVHKDTRKDADKTANKDANKGTMQDSGKDSGDDVTKGSKKDVNKDSSDKNRKSKEEQKKQESTVKDVKLDQVAAPAIDLDFLAEPLDDDMPSDNETPRSTTTPILDRKKSDESMTSKDPKTNDDKISCVDSFHEKRDDNRRNGSHSSSRKHDKSPMRSNRGRDRDRDRDRGPTPKKRGGSLSRSRRSHSRSQSRHGLSRDSSRRRTESSSKRGEDKSLSTARAKDRSSGGSRDRDHDRNDRDRERGNRDRGRDRDRDRDRDRVREKDQPRESVREKGRPRDREKAQDRERDRPRDRKEREGKRGRDAADDDATMGGDRKRRRSAEKERERRTEKSSGGGKRVVTTTSGSSRGSRGGRNRRRGGGGGGGASGDADKRRIEVEGEGKSGGNDCKRPSRKKSDDRGGKGSGEPQAKKRSVLDRLGPKL
ncbi:unnamed protein product [Peronospora belbahrii]|uniref:E3 ubiquitin-protein ligase RBBP6 n=1 Tax=Peronospora belbahrii TaxID=622444 RepID=A0ABN8CPC1_9STRA|nr:unnamed protein product [Peronospora belbahrii]